MANMSPLGMSLALQQPIVQPPKTGVGPTDVVGAYKMATDAANTQYLAKLQQQNAMWGGLAGLGGSALTAGILRGNLFGPSTALKGATTAANAAVPGAATSGVVGAGNFAGVPLAGLTPPAVDAISGGAPLAGLMPPAADTVGSVAADIGGGTAFDTGAAGVPFLTAGGDAAGSIGADLAATGAIDAGAAGAADAGMTLADLLPFLFPVLA